MMVARTELRLPFGVWYFSKETLQKSSEIKSERNSSLFYINYDWLCSVWLDINKVLLHFLLLPRVDP